MKSSSFVRAVIKRSKKYHNGKHNEKKVIAEIPCYNMKDYNEEKERYVSGQ